MARTKRPQQQHTPQTLSIEHVPACVLFLDRKLDIVLVNKAAERLLGIKRAKVVGKPLLRAFPSLKRAISPKRFAAVRAGKHVHFTFYAPMRKRWLEIDAEPAGGGIAVTVRPVSANERQLALIINNSDDAIFAKTLDGTITNWNKAAERLYGYKEHEVVGKHVRIIAPREKHAEIAGILRKLKRGERIDRLRTERVRKDGKRVSVSITVSPIKDEEGTITGASIIARDMTMRLANEERLRLHTTIYKSIGDAVLTTDAEGRITSWNEGAERLFGYTAKEVLGTPDVDIRLATEWPAGVTRETVQRRIYEKGSWSGITKNATKRGETIYLLSTITALKDAEGRLTGVVDIVRDITEIYEIQNELSSYKERLDLAQATSGIGIYDWDFKTDGLWWTKEEARLLGLKEDAKFQSYDAIFKKVHPEDRKAMNERLTKALRARSERLEEEFRVVMPDKSVRWLRGDGRIFYKRGKPVRMLGVNYDITEQKERLEREHRVRQELAEIAERLELAQSTGHIGIFEYNVQTRATWRNAEQNYLFGVDGKNRAEPALDMGKYVHPDDRARAHAAFEEAFAGGKPLELEYRVVHPDGSVHWLRTVSKVTADAKGRPERLIGINLNIDERKQVEAVLSFKAETGRLLSQSLDYKTVLDTIGRVAVPAIADWFSIDIVNERGEVELLTLAHKDPEKVKWARELRKKYPPDTSRTDRGIGKMLVTGASQFFPHIPQELLDQAAQTDEERRLLKKIGFTGAIVVPLRVESKVIGQIALITAESKRRFLPIDLSMAEELAIQAGLAIERTRLYKTVVDERKRLVDLVSDVPAVIWEGYRKPDPAHGRVNFINNYLTALSGYAPDDWYNDPQFMEKLIHPDDRERIWEEGRVAFERGENITQNCRWVTKDGRVIPMEATSFIIKDEDGAPIGTRGVAIDITERAEMERRKDEFISMASHELKTPITSIKLFTEILSRALAVERNGRGNAASSRFIGNIAEQVDKLTDLVSDLLDVSKIQAGKLDLRMQEFPIAQLIEKTIENIQPTAENQKIVMTETSRAQVYGDPDRINQIVVNLLTNAIKYSPNADRIEVAVHATPTEAIVTVRDYGIGIPRQHQQKIFERFYRVYDITDRTFPGLGMGLYISHEIAKKHGGRMWVDSAPGRGSTFYFTIPTGPEGKKN